MAGVDVGEWRPGEQPAGIRPVAAVGDGRGTWYHARLLQLIFRLKPPMKPAKEIRVGNIIMVDDKPFIVLRSDVNGSSRTGFTYKWKMKNLLTNAPLENVFRGDDKFDVVILDKKPVTYSYFADPLYVFMDEEYNQYEIEEENMGDAVNYLKDGMQCEAVFYDGKAISVELPTTIARQV